MEHNNNEDLELINIFTEEATDLVNTISLTLLKWREDLTNNLYLKDIKRDLHTLKGSARMVGQLDIGTLAHELEELSDIFIKEQKPINRSLYELFAYAYDQLSIMIEALKSNSKIELPNNLIEKIKKAARGEVLEDNLQGMKEKPPTVPLEKPKETEDKKKTPQTENITKVERQEKQDKESTRESEIIRVRADTLDKLNISIGFASLAETLDALNVPNFAPICPIL